MDQLPQNPPVDKLARNPETEALHKREVFLQITVPLIIGASVFFGFVIFAIFASAGAKSQGADVALMWLLCMPMILTLLGVAILAALVYGMWKLQSVLPGYLFQVQNFLLQVQAVIRTVADKLVEPFLKVNSTSASVSAFWRSLFKKGT